MKKSRPILWLIKRIRSRIPALLLMTAAHVGQAVFGVWFALGTKQVIDCAVEGKPEAFYQACRQQGAIILGILLCLTLFRHLKEKLTADLDRDWKRQLLHSLLHGDYAAVSRYHSAEILNRMNNDVKIVDDGILTVLPNLAAMITRLAAAITVLASLDPGFTLLIGVLGCLVILVTGLLRRRLKTLHKEVSAQDGVVSGLLQETMEKLLAVQAMDLSDEMERRTDTMLDRRYQMQRKRKNVSLLANTGVSIMSYGAGFLALIWCAGRVLRGEISFGTLTAVTGLVSQLRSPFTGLSGVFPKYIAMTAGAERLMELEQIPSDPEPNQLQPEKVYVRMTALGARSLCFTYDRDVVLRDAGFLLPKGSFAAVTGPSGIGKSTLLKLLLGIYPADSGELFMQTEEGEIPLDRSARRLFAYVPQGNLLFSGTVRENMTVVKPDASETEIARAVYVSNMEDFLRELPRGLDTYLGEAGAGLSEGQAQRLAIARAVLGGAPVLLLDECTSALDRETEQLVLERLKNLGDRTCIAVTHRPAALALCDWQLEIQNGSILQMKVNE